METLRDFKRTLALLISTLFRVISMLFQWGRLEMGRQRRFKIPLWLYLIIAGGVVTFIALLIALLVHWSGIVLQDWGNLQQNPTDETKKKFDASLEIVKVIVGGAGTFATIVGGVILFLNFRVANKTVALAESRLITERFSKAVEQLGSEKIEVRLGGIYTLERIAYDSSQDYWTIMEILTSFIQEKTIDKITKKQIEDKARQMWQNNGADNGCSWENYADEADLLLQSFLITKDIMAALTVVAKRQFKDSPYNRIDLRNVNLIGAKLACFDLSRAKLSNAKLINTDLSSVNFYNTNLDGANLSGADLTGARHLDFAYLSSVNLSGVDLSNVDLSGVKFSGADLSDAYNLTPDQLKDAKLCRTILPTGIGIDPNRDCKELGIPENQSIPSPPRKRHIYSYSPKKFLKHK